MEKPQNTAAQVQPKGATSVWPAMQPTRKQFSATLGDTAHPYASETGYIHNAAYSNETLGNTLHLSIQDLDRSLKYFRCERQETHVYS